jgi:hypothetical protein
MKYLKLYEEFRVEELEETEVQQDQELSDKTIDDVLNPKFFSEEEKEEKESEEVFQDSKGVYHISNWNVY